MKQYILRGLNPTIVLLEQPVELPPRPATAQPDNMNHVWIYDRSGSMHGLLPGLVDQLISKAKTALKIGDTVTLGWFSGEGSRNFIVKGFKIADNADYAKLEAMIRKNAGSLGTTCFSEVIADLNQVVEDLWPINPDFALCFFTDGYPVVNNYERELTNLRAAIAQVQGKLASVLLVGYGAYYNKELLAEMASRFGGALVHSSDLDQFNASMTEFILESRDASPKVEVELAAVSTVGVYFSLAGGRALTYEPKAGKVQFAPIKKSRNALFTVLDRQLPGVPVVSNLDDAGTLRAIYGAALVLTQRTKVNQAIELLGAIGDVALIDAVNNAFTNDDYGRVEAKIRAAIKSPTGRFVAGVNTKHLPDRNAFCLVELVELLVSDESARFYPYHPSFKYQRIGLKTEYDANLPKFEADPNPSCPLDTLTWNDTKLNLSLTTRITGKVPLDDQAARHGFATPYPTFIWRSFSFVKDGNCNMPEAPFSMSLATFNELSAKKLLRCCDRDHNSDGDCDIHPAWQEGQVYLVKLGMVPVMNRAIADGRTSAAKLAQAALEEFKLEAKVKVLKAHKERLEAVGAKDLAQSTPLTAEQEAYLAKFYISRNGFGAPGKAAEPTDSYQAKEFIIKLKGLSGLPSVKAVETKLGTGKKLTLSESLVNDGLALVAQAPKPASQQLTWVNGQLAQHKAELRKVRKDLQRTKFAILLGKAWFTEFNSRTDSTIAVGSTECTVGVHETSVPI